MRHASWCSGMTATTLSAIASSACGERADRGDLFVSQHLLACGCQRTISPAYRRRHAADEYHQQGSADDERRPHAEHMQGEIAVVAHRPRIEKTQQQRRIRTAGQRCDQPKGWGQLTQRDYR